MPLAASRSSQALSPHRPPPSRVRPCLLSRGPGTWRELEASLPSQRSPRTPATGRSGGRERVGRRGRGEREKTGPRFAHRLRRRGLRHLPHSSSSRRGRRLPPPRLSDSGRGRERDAPPRGREKTPRRPSPRPSRSSRSPAPRRRFVCAPLNPPQSIAGASRMPWTDREACSRGRLGISGSSRFPGQSVPRICKSPRPAAGMGWDAVLLGVMCMCYSVFFTSPSRPEQGEKSFCHKLEG